LIFLKDKSLRSRFLFLNSIRITILSALALISLFLLNFADSPSQILPIVVSLFIAMLLSISYFPLFRYLNFRFHIFLQLFIDILVITLLVYLSGGVISPFYFLYILPIITSAIFLTKRDTLYIATLSFIIFGILSDLMYLQIIPFYPSGYTPDISFSSFIYNLLMSFIAFSAVAMIASYYFDKMKKTDEELRNIQENLKDLVLINNAVMEKMENGFITCNDQGRIISYNEKSKKILNLNSRSDIFKILLSAHDQKKLKRITETDQKYYFEKQVNKFILGISVSLLKNIYSFNKIYVFIIVDLTKKKEIEGVLQKKENFAMIGEMAAGIAHEIRNPLASISGSVQFLQKKLELGNELKNLMDIIITESNRLSMSIEEFLEFTKVNPIKKVKTNLSETIDDIIKLLGLNHKNVRFIRKYAPRETVVADPKQLKQLLWNLLNNAVKAVNGKGVVEVNIYNKPDYLAVSIKDNGRGMEPSEKKKIFNPFYSKFTSGIGLGMSIVRRIIEDHGFEIQINSEKNIGTEVIIHFSQSERGMNYAE
jgi:two-component system sensor histidine kinase PilS (NtrC family)